MEKLQIVSWRHAAMNVLTTWLATLRSKTKKKKSKHSISLSSFEERGTHTDVVPMCEFQLRKEFGDGKTDAWLKSGALPYSGDRITGSIEPECREYQVPISWTRNSSKKVDAQTLEAG